MNNQIISCFNNGIYVYGAEIILIAKTLNGNIADYYKPYGSDINNVFSSNKENNSITITGIGKAKLTVVFGETSGLKMTHKTIEIEGIKCKPKIVVKNDNNQSLSLGLSSSISYNVVHIENNEILNIPVRMTFEGESVEFNTGVQKIIAVKYGTTKITFSTTEDKYHARADIVTMIYVVNKDHDIENNLTFTPKLEGIVLKDTHELSDANESQFVSEILLNNSGEYLNKSDVNRLINIGTVQNTDNEKSNCFGIPLINKGISTRRDMELCNNILRTEITRKCDCNFKMFVQDLTTSELDYISITLSDITEIDKHNLNVGVKDILKNLNNPTDIIKIDGYKFEPYEDKYSKKHKYLPLKIYHPHDTLKLYHIDDDGIMREVTANEYPESYVTRDIINPDFWYINAMFSYLIGATNSGSSSGDPHITPIFGPIYELPNKVTNYRFLQGDDIILNVSMRDITSKEVDTIHKFYKVAMGCENSNLVTNGVFMNKVYLNCGKNVLIYDFDSKNLQKTSGDFFKISYVDDDNNQYYETCKKVKSIKIAIIHEIYGEIVISLKHFSNPQVKFGVSVIIDKNTNGCSGLLIREYIVGTMELSNLMLKQNIKGIVSKNKGRVRNMFLGTKTK